MNEQMAKMLFKMLGIDASKLPSAEEIALLFTKLAEIPAKLDEILRRLDNQQMPLDAVERFQYDVNVPDVNQGNLLIEDKTDV